MKSTSRRTPALSSSSEPSRILEWSMYTMGSEALTAPWPAMRPPPHHGKRVSTSVVRRSREYPMYGEETARGRNEEDGWASTTCSAASGLWRCAITSAMPSPLGSYLSAGKRSRQPEPWKHAVVEAGDGADPVAREGEDEQAGPVADAGRGAEVGPERRLTVGSRRYEVEPPARADHACVEAGHDVTAFVFEGERWHREKDIVGQQGDQSVEIAGLVRADELRHRRLLGGRVGGGSRFAIGTRRQPALQAGARPLEEAVDRLD